ncbi:unnamed protein product [Nesidiocoris tenuis]|uniref:Uncharacterized protein n=1 Tax=Nesidiocoris tenuis TaxID=355587 RepID=A0A6H5GN86_9HEMI|nr:unnamed protein product [Nesidiocoris tenuis]
MSFSTSTFPPENLWPKTSKRLSEMCEATSIPTSSTKVAAPTGKPNCFESVSSCLGSTPSCSIWHKPRTQRVDQKIDYPQLFRLVSSDVLSGEAQIQRGWDGRETWKPLSATTAGKKTKHHFWQSDGSFLVFHGDPVVASESYLEMIQRGRRCPIQCRTNPRRIPDALLQDHRQGRNPGLLQRLVS